MVDYTPRTFTKDGQTTIAEDIFDDRRLVWEGWTPGAPFVYPRDSILATLADLDEAIAGLGGGGGGGVTDHGALTGLTDDDHTQYHTDARGDVRYYLKAEVDTLLASTSTTDRDRGNHTGTQSADTLTDGATNKAFLATERTKLTGIATGATANATDAQLRDRSTHTGTQTSATISDFTEAAQDAVAAMLASGSNVTLNYNDAANSLSVSASGPDAEATRDTIGAALVGLGLITVTPNDALDTISISTTATANSSDAALRDRSTHTGTQSADTLTDGTTNKAFLATERTKLSGIATGATANSSDATLLARGNHTGTQSADTLTDGTTNKAFLATERTKLTGIATGATANSTDATLLARANHTGTQTASTISDLDSATITFTNKRVTRRVGSNTTASSLNANVDNVDAYKLTALASNLALGAPAGTPTAMQSLIYRFKDNGTARTITWNAIYRAVGVTLPTTTVVNKTLYAGCVWNADDSKWDVIAISQEA